MSSMAPVFLMAIATDSIHIFNDTFPKDWAAFFTGQPIQYLKLGTDALKLNAYPGAAKLELVIADFRPDNMPTARRFIFSDPLPAGRSRRSFAAMRSNPSSRES